MGVICNVGRFKVKEIKQRLCDVLIKCIWILKEVSITYLKSRILTHPSLMPFKGEFMAKVHKVN